jgi:DNA-directed RNA polymerase specialized sigma24 family protein
VTAASPSTILAGNLGLGALRVLDEFYGAVAGRVEDEYRSTVTDPGADHHGMLLSIHNDANLIPTWTSSLTGHHARVHVEWSLGGTTGAETMPLHNVWRVVDMNPGATIDSILPAEGALATFGMAGALARGYLWEVDLWDLRGAAILLLTPFYWAAVVDKFTHEGRRGRRESHALRRQDAMALAAGAAGHYLAEQLEELTDGGVAPVFWTVTRRPLPSSAIEGVAPFAWSSGLPQGPGRPRLWRLRTAVVAELGQGRRVDRATPITRMAFDERWMRPANNKSERASWDDEVGDTAAALADGAMSFEVMSAEAHRGPLKKTALEFIERNVRQGLTPRQAQVVLAYDCGFTDREIGTVLGLAPSTVSAHRYAAYRKLKKSYDED